MNASTPGDGPRVAIVGARRARQGLGPFVVRELVRAGARPSGFLATRRETLESTREQLRELTGGEPPHGYLDLGELIEAEAPEGIAILAPSASHRAHLRAALEAGLHALCEKPLVWGGADPVGAARELAEGFCAAGLVLMENCQWPETLPFFEELHPGVLAGEPRRFTMRLSPRTLGRERLGDCLPHPISMLQALRPADDVRLEGVRYSSRDPEEPNLTLRFHYVPSGPGGPVEVEIELAPGPHEPRKPREAGYGIDGLEVRREVEMPGYRLFFAGGGTRVPITDPLAARIRRFVGVLESARAGGQTARDEAERARHTHVLVQRMELLSSLVDSYESPDS